MVFRVTIGPFCPIYRTTAYCEANGNNDSLDHVVDITGRHGAYNVCFGVVGEWQADMV